MSSMKYWVWLSEKSGIRAVNKYRLLESLGNPEAIYFAEERLLTEAAELNARELEQLRDKNLDRALEILDDCDTGNISIVTYADASYPERLRNIFDPPAVLYVRGRLPAVDELPLIGVVGTREATPYGIRAARMLGGQLAAGGGVVVTGLAAGIDSAAAEGALRAGGRCIGVLGCAIDKVYPAFNDVLYDDVAAAGALVSEYPPKAETDRHCFPVRNRIISGLSAGVVIIEAPKKSGALITASRALEQGREVFAVPGNIDAPNCEGSINLIKEGAALVTNGWDVLSVFSERFPDAVKGPDKTLPVGEAEGPAVYSGAAPKQGKAHERREKSRGEAGRGFALLRVRNDRKNIDREKKREYIDLKDQLEGLTEAQLKIVSVMDSPEKHIDDIIAASGLQAAAVLADMTILQIKGVVTAGSGKRFTLNVSKNSK